MAKVRATQVRVVIQYRDEAGHRLPSEKGGWKEILTTDILLLDCPKCPEPEPAGCQSSWHRLRLADLQNSTVTYCPQCGKRLREA